MDADSLKTEAENRLADALDTVHQMRAVIGFIEDFSSKRLHKVNGGKVDEETVAATGSDLARSGGCKLGRPRPSGIPSNDVMFASVLKDAHREGTVTLSGAEVVESIRQRFWPGVVGAQVLPSLHTAAKKGKLIKTPDGRFKCRPLARNKETTDTRERIPVAS